MMTDPVKNRKQGKNWENVVRANMPFGTTRIPDRVGGADFQAWNGDYHEAKSGNSQLRPKQVALRDQDPERYYVHRGPGDLPDVPNISERVFLPVGYKSRKRLQNLDDTDMFDY